MSLPNSPMMLDSTGQTIVQKLQGIIDALGGGGGGDMVMPPEYDPELEDNTKGYFRGQYVTYNESLYKCKQFIYVTEGTPAGPFDDTKWDEITDLFDEFFQLKPGLISNLRNHNEIFNDYTGNTITGGQFAHAEGLRTTASNTSHAEGVDTTTTGSYCHAEGYGTNAGGQNESSGAHAEGENTTASGGCSHSEGYYTTASGSYSHAGGYRTTALGEAETAIGKYNSSIDPTQDQNYLLFSVGNGDWQTPSNAFAVKLDGTCLANGQRIIAIDPPIADGTYKLRCTVSSGVVTYAWVADV